MAHNGGALPWRWQVKATAIKVVAASAVLGVVEVDVEAAVGVVVAVLGYSGIRQ